MKKNNNSGFSLVEMTVVIVVIGIIVGAVVSSKSMLRNYRVMSVISDVEEFRASIDAFSSKYKSLPGDMSDAADYWSACTDTGGNTCNGDDNGMVEYVATAAREDLRAWEHLNHAEMVKNDFTGREDVSGNLVVDVNVPISKTKSGAFDLFYYTDSTGRVGNMIRFASVNGANLDAGVITPQEAENIDLKIDDGKSLSGEVVGENGDGVTGCIDTVPTPDEYDLDGVVKDCILSFWLETVQ